MFSTTWTLCQSLEIVCSPTLLNMSIGYLSIPTLTMMLHVMWVSYITFCVVLPYLCVILCIVSYTLMLSLVIVNHLSLIETFLVIKWKAQVCSYTSHTMNDMYCILAYLKIRSRFHLSCEYDGEVFSRNFQKQLNCTFSNVVWQTR